MKKIIILSFVTLIVVMAIIIGHSLRQPFANEHMTLAQAESDARQKTHLPACLDLQAQNVPNANDGKAISEVVGAKLTARPKTTTYGLYFKSFSTVRSTGTIIYDGTSSNTFNFAVSRTSIADTWKLTSFVACE